MKKIQIERTSKAIKLTDALCKLGLLIAFISALYAPGGWKALAIFSVLFFILAMVFVRWWRWWQHD